jgi:hypothetical protein
MRRYVEFAALEPNNGGNGITNTICLSVEAAWILIDDGCHERCKGTITHSGTLEEPQPRQVPDAKKQTAWMEGRVSVQT